jgi:hypothetical protein
MKQFIVFLFVFIIGLYVNLHISKEHVVKTEDKPVLRYSDKDEIIIEKPKIEEKEKPIEQEKKQEFG